MAGLRLIPRFVLDLGVFTDHLRQLTLEVRHMSETLAAELGNLQARVAEMTSVNQGTSTLLSGLSDRLSAALARAAQNGATPEQLAEFHDLNNQIGQQNQALAAAVSKNTPADMNPNSQGGGGTANAGADQGSAAALPGGSQQSGGTTDGTSGTTATPSADAPAA